ncbi:hypothetical protein LNQ03_04250 [Klebsiella pneumoniae subsp. pneumoniae]|nr:hypothetical protein [Klebsiella pneumoniae subsp. pneumoniae]
MMIRLYPEQLRAQLTEGLRAAYLLLGNDPLLLQESQDAIREAAAAQGFTEHHTFFNRQQHRLAGDFRLSQAMSLFASRQTLLLDPTGKRPQRGDQLNSSPRWLACCTTTCC